MNCIDCDGPTWVIETARDDCYVFRRRKCKVCGRTFHTVEDLVPEELTLLEKNAFIKRRTPKKGIT